MELAPSTDNEGAPLLTAHTSNNRSVNTQEMELPSGKTEARLICILAREYNIQNKPELQVELAKLIYLRHVKNVFVDSDPAGSQQFITNESLKDQPINKGPARFVYGNIIDTPGLLQQYLGLNNVSSIKNAIKLYIAPTYEYLKKLVKNSTGGDNLEQENSVYMLCPNTDNVLKHLIIVLQKMGFNKNYFKDGIHIQANQINSIFRNAITRMLPGINQLLQNGGTPPGDASPSAPGSARFISVLDPSMPNVKAANIRMDITSSTDNPSGNNIILLAPKASTPVTGPQSVSLLNFLSIKPDTKTDFKNMAKKEDVPQKTDARDHNQEAIAALGTSVPQLYQQNVEKEIPTVKTSLEGYKKALSEFKSQFEKFEKEYKSGSGEKARIYKKYISGIFVEQEKGENTNAEGFRISELYYKLLKDKQNDFKEYKYKDFRSEENYNYILPAQLYDTIALEKTTISSAKNATAENLSYFAQLIKHFTYGGDTDIQTLEFDGGVMPNITKHYKEFKENGENIKNTIDFFDRTRDLAYILEYINGYSYYKRNIYNLNHFIRYYSEKYIDLKTRKTLKNKVPAQREITDAKYSPIKNLPTEVKEKVAVNASNVKLKLNELIQKKKYDKQALEPLGKAPLHKRFFGETKKKYKKARELSKEIAALEHQKNMIKSPASTTAHT